ncbi:MAG: TolC family protein, partial [Acidobacteria bacterium]|nr:TolC family protein [Acidobacteriota bacterium]
MIRPLLASFTVLAVLVTSATAQTPAAPPAAGTQAFTLQAALEYAIDHYPAIRAALEQVNVSTAGLTAAQSAYLPRLDSVLQMNRATVNNVTGPLLPQSVIPGISGPPLPSGSSQSAWGTAAGALFSWELFDFGLRQAGVLGAQAAATRARADASLTRLEVQSAVGAAFLAVVQAEQALVATQADVARREVLARVARTLADNQLRPGAEASRADAERAAAETRAILARQTLVLAQTTLARVLGVTTGPVSVRAAGLLGPAPSGSGGGDAAGSHPLALAREAAVDAARTQEEVLAHTDRPRVYLQTALFARGSGASFNGGFDLDASGLGFDRANWAAGVQVVLPNLFDGMSLRARRAAAAAATRAEAARYDEAVLVVASQQQAAAAMVDAARAVAASTPVQLAAARQSEAQASARYRAGLASIVE